MSVLYMLLLQKPNSYPSDIKNVDKTELLGYLAARGAGGGRLGRSARESYSSAFPPLAPKAHEGKGTRKETRETSEDLIPELVSRNRSHMSQVRFQTCQIKLSCLESYTYK